MKAITVAVLATTLIGGIYFVSNLELTQVYKNEVEYIDNTPEELKNIIDCPECIQAAKDVARRLEVEAELESLSTQEDELTAKYQAGKAVIDAKQMELEKELGTY